VEEIQKYLKDHVDASPSDLSEFVTNQQMSFALKAHHKIHMFIRASINHNFFKEKQIQKFAPVMNAITQSNPIMERHLIGAIEGICANKPKHFPIMIKLLFDEEVLDEGVILEWSSEARTDFTVDSLSEDVRVALRNEADPVIQWLQQDDDSDGESDASD
jgi:translation initiation factor 5